jgi:outer membrane protein TolC
VLLAGVAVTLAACAGRKPLTTQAETILLVPAPVASLTTAAPVDDGPLSLDQALELAVADNPGLAEIQARARALAAIPSQAGTLPDPVLSLNALSLPVDTFNLDQEPMTQLQVGVSQALPFPGKLGLRQEAASHEAVAAAEEVNERHLTLIRDVKLVWWNLFYLDRALEIVARNQDLMRQFVDIAQVRYRVGEGLQQDVLLAQVELSRLLDQEIRLRGMRRTEEARLNALLNRPTDSPVSLPSSVPAELPEPVVEDTLYRLAEEHRPLLAVQQSRIEAAGSRLALAQKDYYPDFRLGAVYGFRQGSDPIRGDRADLASIMLSMNLPIFVGRKQDRAVDQRGAELLKQRYALQNARQQVREQVAAALADYRRTQEQVQLLKTGILPQARQTVDSMLAGYRTNKVDFLNLVRAQITLYNDEIQLWNVFSMANQSLARLTAAVGQEAIYE